MPSSANQRRRIRARDDQDEADRAPERDQHRSRGCHELLAERLHADPHVAIRVWVQACQVRRHGVHRRAGLPNGHVVRQARDDGGSAPAASGDLASEPANRQEELAVSTDDGIADSRRQHANDRAGHAIDHDGAADDRGIALITSAPRNRT